MRRIITLCFLLTLSCFAYSQGVKNVSGQLYCYATNLNSPGVKKTFSSLTPDTEYSISAWIWDSVGTNIYTLTVMNESETAALGSVTSERGKPTLTFKVPAGTKDVHFYINSSNSTTGSLPAHNFYIDNVQLTYIGPATVQEPVDNYRLGFNGQEKDNEIDGNHNSYNAQFWQYDPRLGRRWNLDPKPDPSISGYATFRNNPISYTDPKGDTAIILLDREGGAHQGHLGALIQDKTGQWYYASLFAEDLSTPNKARILSGLDTKGVLSLKTLLKTANNREVSMSKEEAIAWAMGGKDDDQTQYDTYEEVATTRATDNIIYQNVIALQKQIEEGTIKYNLYNYNCKDAVVDMIRKNTNVQIPDNQAATRPNEYMSEYSSQKIRDSQEHKSLMQYLKNTTRPDNTIVVKPIPTKLIPVKQGQ